MKASYLIRDARVRAGFSQSELADRLGTKQPAIARWESGDSDPRSETLGRILEACGLQVIPRLEPIDFERRRQLRAQLALTPAQRVSQLVRTVRFIEATRTR